MGIIAGAPGQALKLGHEYMMPSQNKKSRLYKRDTMEKDFKKKR
jgi:hypothetical protein